jgi:hypothetical protein
MKIVVGSCFFNKLGELIMPKYTFESNQPAAILAVLTELMTIAYLGIAKVMREDTENEEKLINDREKARTTRRLFEERVNKLNELLKKPDYTLKTVFDTCFTCVTNAIYQQLDEGIDMPVLYPVIKFLCDSLNETNIRSLYENCSPRDNFFKATEDYTKRFSKSDLKQVEKLISASGNEIEKQRTKFNKRSENLYQSYLESRAGKTDITRVGIKPSIKSKVDDVALRARAAKEGEEIPDSPQLSTLKTGLMSDTRMSPRMWGRTANVNPPLVRVLGQNILYRFMAVTLVLNDNCGYRNDESLPFLQDANLKEVIDSLVGIIGEWRKNWERLDNSDVGITYLLNQVYFKLQSEAENGSEFWQLMIVLCVHCVENIVSKFENDYKELDEGKKERESIKNFSGHIEKLASNDRNFNFRLIELNKIDESRNNLEEYTSTQTLESECKFLCDVVQKLINCNVLVRTFNGFVKEHSKKKVDETTPLLGERGESEESPEGCCKCCTIL